MARDHYILDEHHNAVPVDLMVWAEWYETADRRVARDVIGTAPEGVTSFMDAQPLIVSTVFLGLDHSFKQDPSAPPSIFETMVFGHDRSDVYMRRYATWDEAVEGHAQAVEWATPRPHPKLGTTMTNVPHHALDYMYVLVNIKWDAYMDRNGLWTSERWRARTFTRDEALDAMRGSALILDDGRWLPIGTRFYLDEEEERDVAT